VSTVLEAEITLYKLTSSSLSEQFKKVSCAKMDFFVRVRTKYRTFSRTTHNKNINQLID
jgi:hypothetical protein